MQIENLQSGYRHIAYDEIGSTNEVAREMGTNGDPGKLWVTAKKQISGKGSRGRQWVSEPGNLYASLMLRFELPVTVLANLTFVASLAVQEAISHFVPEPQLKLKWPNDVLMNGRKISGILLENVSIDANSSIVVIGMGINCKTSPSETNYPAINLLDAGYVCEPQQLFAHLVASMDKMLKFWANGENFNGIRDSWISRAYGIGEQIRVVTAKQELTGMFEKLDHDGCLILKTANNQRHVISTADIFPHSNQKA